MAALPEAIEPDDLDGATILVGITRLHADGSCSQEQFAGRATLKHRQDFSLVELQCTDGEQRSYPFDALSLQRAPEGEYRLRSTGEMIENPDFLMTWEVSEGGNE